MLPKGHQQIIVFNPILLWQFFPQRHLGLFWVFRFYVAPAIGNAMNMGVHTDSRFVETKSHDEVGGLSAYAFQFEQLVDLIGNFAGIFFLEGFTYLANVLSLDTVKSHRKDGLFNGFDRQLDHRLRRLREGKQAATGLGSGVILGPETQDTGDEDMKGSMSRLGHEGHNRGFPLGHFPSQNSDRLMNIACFHFSGFFSLVWID